MEQRAVVQGSLLAALRRSPIHPWPQGFAPSTRARAVPLAQRAKSSKAGRFDDSRLRLFQSFVLNAGGCGLSGGDIDDIWHLFHEWEPKEPAKEGEPPRLRDIFTSAHALKQALSHDIDEALLSEDWTACSMTELGEAYEAYFRPALGVLLEAMNAPKVRYWARGSEKEGPRECRETPFDGDAFRLCQEDVIREHGDAAFVLGIHVFSDSCALTSSGGHKLYPVRIRVINAATDEDEWHTITYIPHIRTEKTSGGAERSRLRRMTVLQRVLYLAFRSTISAGHTGVEVLGGVHGPLRAFPRILLYICDQPEERAVLCLKLVMRHRPCSICDVTVSSMATKEALRAKDRCPLRHVEKQLEAHGHREHGRESQRRCDIERKYSVNSQPPALAATAGLCTPPFLLFKMIGLDVLHVRFRCLLPLQCFTEDIGRCV